MGRPSEQSGPCPAQQCYAFLDFLNGRMIDPGAKTIQIVNKEEMSKSPDALEIMYK